MTHRHTDTQTHRQTHEAAFNLRFGLDKACRFWNVWNISLTRPAGFRHIWIFGLNKAASFRTLMDIYTTRTFGWPTAILVLAPAEGWKGPSGPIVAPYIA